MRVSCLSVVAVLCSCGGSARITEIADSVDTAPTERLPPRDVDPRDTCNGTRVERLSGQVLGADGNPLPSGRFSICGNVCVFSELADDGTFSVSPGSQCWWKEPPLVRPFFHFFDDADHTELSIDFAEPGVSPVPATTLATAYVPRVADMHVVDVNGDEELQFTDGAGFSLSAPAGSIDFGFGKPARLGAARVAPDRAPPIPGSEALLAVYATWPGDSGFVSPARAVFPNDSGLEPGTALDVMILGSYLTAEIVYPGRWGRVAGATVNAAGDAIEMDEGAGLDFLTWIALRRAQ
jgi:hypothetical protein